MIVFTSIWIKLIASTVAVLSTVRFGAGIYFYRQTELLERPSYTVLQVLSDGVELRQYAPYLIAETEVDGVGFKEPTGQGFRSCAKYIFGQNKPRQRQDKKSLVRHSLESLFGRNNKKKSGSSVEGEKMAMTAPVRVSGESSSTSSSSSVGEKMAMTAPVRVDGTGKGSTNTSSKTKVSFVIGKKYTLKTVPKPVDKNVKIRQVPSHVLAVRTFSGPPPNDERVEKERQRVEAALQKANIEIKTKTTTTSSSSEKKGNTLVYGYHDPFICPNMLRRNEVALVVEGNV